MKDRRVFLNSIGKSMVPAALLTSAAASANGQSSSMTGLEGCWFAENTPAPIPGFPPEAQEPPFSEIVVFGAGGTLVENNSSLHHGRYVPGSPSPINFSGSSGLGSWRATGSNAFNAIFYKYLYSADRHVGYLKVSGTITLIDQNSFTADWIVEFQLFDPQAPRISAGVRTSATRIQP